MADHEQLEAEARSGSSGTTSMEDLSEVLDEDKLGGDYPPDEPVGAFEYGVTPMEQRVQEPIDERVEREVPEPMPGDPPAPDVDRTTGDDLPVGDVGSGDTTTYDVVTERSGDLSAEEAAVHLRELP